MKIFRASIDRLDELAGLYDQYRQFYERPPDRKACLDFMADRLRNGESVVFAAQDEEGVLVGFTQLYRSFCSVEMAELIYLYDLFVAPAARKTGVGRALMEAARQYALKRGAASLKLETAVDNHPAQALYESLGWKRDEDFYSYCLQLRPAVP